MPPRTFAYFAQSLDGFIAGPDGDLSFLGEPDDEAADAFEEVMARTGALLMGRNTYDVVADFGEDQWPYGDTPVVVATKRPLETTRNTVHTASGSPRHLLDVAQALAGDKRVYVDGGDVVRQMLNADLLDELTVSLVPTAVGDGVRLFMGPIPPLVLKSQRSFSNGTVALTYAVNK